MPLPRLGPRAQAAMEVIILLAVGLAVLALVLTAAQERLTTSESVLRAQQAQSAVNAIARAADEVFGQGIAARRSVNIILPEGTAGSAITNRTLVLQLRHAGGLTDVLARTNVDVYGSLPDTPGPHTVWVTAEEQRVQIRQSLQDFSLNPTLLFNSALISGSVQNAQTSTTATNLGTSTLTVNTQLNWTPTLVAVTYANPGDTTFVLAPGTSKAIAFNITINANVTGTFTGTLSANASNNDTALVNIIVEVVSGVCPTQSCPPGARTVARITGNTYRDTSYTKVKLVFESGGAGQLVQINGTGWPAGANVTLDLRNPSNVSVGGFPKLKSADAGGGFNDSFDPTNATGGTYTVVANTSNATKTWPFTITGCT